MFHFHFDTIVFKSHNFHVIDTSSLRSIISPAYKVARLFLLQTIKHGMSRFIDVGSGRDAHLRADAWTFCCRDCVCSTFRILCCCKGMRRSTRMKLLFAYLQVAGVVLGVITGVVIFSPIENELSSLGMKYVSRHLSTMFCEGVSIQSKISGTDIDTDEKFSAYLMDSVPNLLGKYNTISYNETYVKFVPVNGYEYQQFYFLQGSTVHVTANVQSLTSLFVVKGYKNFKSGTSAGDTFSCAECFLYVYTFFPEEEKHDVKISITDSDDYFFVYQTSDIKDSWVTVNYCIRRTVYDTIGCIDDCKNISNCDFLFPDFTGSYGVIIQREKSNFKEPVNIETMCIIRVWMFTVLFFTLPLIISIVGSCFIYSYCKEPDVFSTLSTRNRRSRNNTIQRSESPLLAGSAYPNYSTVFLPPKYDDVVKTRDGALPSYEEAVGADGS